MLPKIIKRHQLSLVDLGIVTLLLFGEPIYQSTLTWLAPIQTSGSELVEATANDYPYMLIKQGGTLLIVIAYLLFRRFDFKQWTFHFSWSATLKAIGMFLVLAGLTDIFLSLLSPRYLTSLLIADWDMAGGLSEIVAQFTNLPMVAYSLLNGCYEETFFIGMCTAVKDTYKPWVFLASLLIRFAFHTYQGLIVALAISLILGLFYYFWYTKKDKNLYPIFLSHALADILGLSLTYYFIAS